MLQLGCIQTSMTLEALILVDLELICNGVRKELSTV